MGLIKAATDSLGGTLADQWLDLITAGYFDEHTVVAPGVLKSTNNGRGSNLLGSQGVISNGSKIFVPENTVAYIFSQGGIETVVSEPGPYEYQDGESSVFSGGNSDSLFRQLGDRFSHGGISSSEKRIAFVNLREIRDIKFGTRGPQVYNDHYYECDLEIYAYGGFSVKVVDADKFIRNFVPANVSSYTFDDPKARGQMVSEFLQSFIVALNGMSSTYRISQLPAQAVEIAKRISEDTYNHEGCNREYRAIRPFSSARQPVLFQPNEREGLRGHLRASWQHGRPAENCARYPGQWSWRRWRHAIRHEYGASHRSTGAAREIFRSRDVCGRED